jgi:hypothetical protein
VLSVVFVFMFIETIRPISRKIRKTGLPNMPVAPTLRKLTEGKPAKHAGFA